MRMSEEQYSDGKKIMMEEGVRFKEKMRGGGVCLGTNVSFSDPTVSESLCGAGLDFVWIDMEHGPLGIESVQGHVMATQLSRAASLVRVAANDPILIKLVLDVGASGVIVPMIRTAAEARSAVAACRYPPDGIRGYGPRRPSHYGRLEGPTFCADANDRVVTILQIEHIDAVRSLDEILDVPGVDGILIGANDLAGSVGVPAQSENPEVVRAIDTIVQKAQQRDVPFGVPVGDEPQAALDWIERGARWIAVGGDVLFLVHAMDRLVAAIQAGMRVRLGA